MPACYRHDNIEGYTETKKMLLLVTGGIVQYFAVSDRTSIQEYTKMQSAKS